MEGMGGFAQQVTWLADGWVGGLVGGWKVWVVERMGGDQWVSWLADCWVGLGEGWVV